MGADHKARIKNRDFAMTYRTLFLARLIGLFASILGFAMLAQKRSVVETAALVVHDRPLLFAYGQNMETAGGTGSYPTAA